MLSFIWVRARALMNAFPHLPATFRSAGQLLRFTLDSAGARAQRNLNNPSEGAGTLEGPFGPYSSYRWRAHGWAPPVTQRPDDQRDDERDHQHYRRGSNSKLNEDEEMRAHPFISS